MQHANDDFEARFAALTQAFAAALPQRREAVTQSWQAWCAGDTAARDVLQASVHRLAGAADNYGYTALGAAARALDARLLPRLAATPPQLAAELQALLAAFDLPPEAATLD